MLRYTSILIQNISLVNQNILHCCIKQVKTSRQIQLEMLKEKTKQKLHNYKSLNTKLGLNKPTIINKNYAKPQKISYNLQSFRQCSNLYPQYLQKQLDKKNSPFYKVIYTITETMWKLNKTESLECIYFFIKWDLIEYSEEIQTVCYRSLLRLRRQLLLQDIFQSIKHIIHLNQKSSPAIRQKILNFLMNQIIVRLNQLQNDDYQTLIKIVSMCRTQIPKIDNKIWQQSNETLQQSIQSIIIRKMQRIPPKALVHILVHYTNNHNELQDNKYKIIEKIKKHMIKNIKFINQDELIAVMYCYIKVDMLFGQLMEHCIKRIELLYDDMKMQKKIKIIQISSMLSKQKRMLIIAIAQQSILNNKNQQQNVIYKMIPQLYLASFQVGLLTDQLISLMQNILINYIMHLSAAQVVTSVWLFTTNSSKDLSSVPMLALLHKKLEIMIQNGVLTRQQYTVKQISMLVWSFCNAGLNNSEIYNTLGDYWNNIEHYLEWRLSQPSTQTPLQMCSYILWAYTNNRPIRMKMVNTITQIIINNSQQMTIFQLLNILAYYTALHQNQLPQNLYKNIYKICLNNFTQLYSQMNNLQLVRCLKYFIISSQQFAQLFILKITIWQYLLKYFMKTINQMEYNLILALRSILLHHWRKDNSNKQIIKLINALSKRKVQLQQLTKL